MVVFFFIIFFSRTVVELVGILSGGGCGGRLGVLKI
jgi:hypothetical protein